MKSIILIIAVPLILFSCSKDDSIIISSSSVSNFMQNGDWIIDYYWDSDHDETSHFTGYSFNFSSNGVLKASEGTNEYSGSWSTGSDDSQVKLIILFASPVDLSELSDDWHVTESSDNKISLEDVSGGNGQTDYLVFIKR